MKKPDNRQPGHRDRQPGHGVNQKWRSLFYDNLSTMCNSGITIANGLKIMNEGKSGEVFRMLDGLQHDISRGRMLWQSMAGYPRFFDQFQVLLIKSAETSGSLVETCKGMFRYYEMRYKEKRKLIAGLIYPIILMHAVVLLPPLKYLFLDNLDRSYASVVLPPLLMAYGLVGFAYLFLAKFSRSGKMRERVDGWVLSIPLLGKLMQSMSMARVLRTLSNMNNAGIPPLLAIAESIKTAGNRSITNTLEAALPVLENGGSYTGFFSFTGLLPRMQLGMIEVGEEGGQLSHTLDKLVKRMEEDNSHQLSNLIKYTGIALYLTAAAIAAYTVVSFYAGYFTMS